MKKKLIRISLFLFVLANVIAFNHAYRMTHFSATEKERTKKIEALSTFDKIKTVLLGVSIPRPIDTIFPKQIFETVYFESDLKLESWLIQNSHPKGVVLMFHGFASSKSGLLRYAEEFYKAGYTTLLTDLRGNGGSEGHQCTIGFKESKDVKASIEYVQKRFPNQKIILFGSSMGAASIMKAVESYDVVADRIILECPFGSMRKTTKARFNSMGIPSFPFTDMLLFYGGLQNGFNAWQHKPEEYAKKISTSTLLLYGARDPRVSRSETDLIFKNLQGPKTLGIMENSGHEIYLNDDASTWKQYVFDFLEN